MAEEQSTPHPVPLPASRGEGTGAVALEKSNSARGSVVPSVAPGIDRGGICRPGSLTYLRTSPGPMPRRFLSSSRWIASCSRFWRVSSRLAEDSQPM